MFAKDATKTVRVATVPQSSNAWAAIVTFIWTNQNVYTNAVLANIRIEMATATGVILPVLSATAHSKKIVSNAPVIANIFQTAFAIHNHAQQPLI